MNVTVDKSGRLLLSIQLMEHELGEARNEAKRTRDQLVY